MVGSGNFSDDFKLDAVAQITECGHPVSEISKCPVCELLLCQAFLTQSLSRGDDDPEDVLSALIKVARSDIASAQERVDGLIDQPERCAGPKLVRALRRMCNGPMSSRSCYSEDE